MESIVAVLGLTEKSVIKRQRRFQKCIQWTAWIYLEDEVVGFVGQVHQRQQKRTIFLKHM